MNNQIITQAQLDDAKKIFLTHSKIVEYEKYNLIIRANTLAKDLFFIIEGKVSVFTKDVDSDKTLVIGNLKAGDFVGEMGLFHEQNLRSAWVEAKERAKLAYMSYDKFIKISQTHINLWQLLTKQLSIRLQETSNRYKNLAFLDVAGRISNLILDMAKSSDSIQDKNSVTIPINRTEIAKNIGCSREMVGKVLSELEIEGVIENHARHIIILNEQIHQI